MFSSAEFERLFLQSIHLDFRCNPDPCVLCFKCVIVAIFHIDHVIIRQFKMSSTLNFYYLYWVYILEANETSVLD